MEFSNDSTMVDAERRQVSVTGKAQCTNKPTFQLQWANNDPSTSLEKYHVQRDPSNGFVVAAACKPRQVVLIAYEFTYAPFSGNGILARSIVKIIVGTRLLCNGMVLSTVAAE
jgi:hypothetical protein